LRVHEVLGGGHAVNEERPEELVPKVRAFLAEPE
jgi:pimeloyl-ACP methyl ester carboxylesterase